MSGSPLETSTAGGKAPHDLAAERAVLGGLIADNGVFTELASVIQPDDFFLPAHGEIFHACVSLQTSPGAPRPIDQVTLSDELRGRGKLQTVGGPGYLAELEASVPTSQNALSYARIVADKATRRRLLAACTQLAQLASEETGDLPSLLDEAERRVFAIAEKQREGDLLPFRSILDSTLQIIDKLRESGSAVTGLSTGFIDLDHQLTGMHAGELIILAARPGVGKTSFALNVATHAAVKAHAPVAIFSLEMPSDQLAMRLLAAEARLDMKRIRQGALSSSHMEKIQDASSKLWNAPIYIDDTGSLSAFDLRAKARRLDTSLRKGGGKLGLVVIDYLQLMHQRGRVESREREVAEISRSLKSLAKELQVPIVALSQLNRKVEERTGKKSRPMLSDLRESGSIEQDADVVMFIHKVAEEEEGAGPSDAVELIVAKQRNGPTGSIDLLFNPGSTRFENKARSE